MTKNDEDDGRLVNRGAVAEFSVFDKLCHPGLDGVNAAGFPEGGINWNSRHRIGSWNGLLYTPHAGMIEAYKAAMHGYNMLLLHE